MNRLLGKFVLLVLMLLLGYFTFGMLTSGEWFGSILFGLPTLLLFLFLCGVLGIKTPEEHKEYMQKKGLRK